MPSLGAGGSLVVAALCCLLVASAFISFRDWPGRGDASPGGTITMTPPAAKAAGRAASGPSAPTAAVAAPVVDRAAGVRSADRGATRRTASTRPAPAGTNPPASAPAPAPVAGPAPPSPRSAAAAPAPAAPVADPQPPAREPGRAEQIVEDVRKTTDPIPLPPAVKEPVQPVLETVEQVGRTVDETTGPLLPALP